MATCKSTKNNKKSPTIATNHKKTNKLNSTTPNCPLNLKFRNNPIIDTIKQLKLTQLKLLQFKKNSQL